MELHQLRYFVAAAEAGAISRAALRCRVAQPSLSQQIQKLETSLGARLFDRQGRGVALTDAGRALLPRARRILAEAHEIQSNLRADIEGGPGRLAVGAIPTMAPFLLPALLGELRAERPGCELIVREDLTENLVDAIVENELDVAVMSAPVDHPLVDVEVIGAEELLVVAPASRDFRREDEISLADLRAEPAVTLHEMHCLGRQISGFCADRRLAANIVCRTTQLATVLEFVRLGLGVSLVPAMAAHHDKSPGRVYLHLKRSPPRRDIALVWRRGRTKPLLARRFAELLQARMEREA